MADYYDTGTVSVLSGNRTVTGAGTSWAGLIRAGDTLEIGGRQMRVASVESATSLTLKLPAPAAASGAYAIWYSAPSRTSGLQALADMRRQIELGEILNAMRGDYGVRGALINAPPASPVTGDMYIIGTAPTGAWAGYVEYLAYWTGTGWAFTAATPGTRAYVIGAGINWQRGEAAWGRVPGVVSLLGVSGSLTDATGLLNESAMPPRLSSIPIRETADANNLVTAGIWGINGSAANLPVAVNGDIIVLPFNTITQTQIFVTTHAAPQCFIRRLDNGVGQPWSRLNDDYFLSPSSAYNAQNSTVFCKCNASAAVAAGGTVSGSSLSPAGFNASGAVSSSAAVFSGTWLLCGLAHTAGATDYGMYRRVA